MSVWRAAFNLGARVGSLEGYIYEGKSVDPHYLPGWIANIEKEMSEFPPDVRSEIHADYREIMKKIEQSMSAILPAGDPALVRVQKIIAD